MKARRRNSNDNWQEIEYLLLENSSYPQSADLMEFEQDVITAHDTLSTELKTFDQAEDEKHWQDVRESAAIAAMQGTIIILSNSDRTAFRDIVVDGYKGGKRTYPNEVAEFAYACANALVEQLKTRN